MNHTEAAAAQALKAESLPTDFCFPNKPEELPVLEYAVSILPSAPKAHYYLGEFFYDRKQYDAAVSHWQAAAKEQPDLAPAHRNLSIAYYNPGGRSLAAAEDGQRSPAFYRRVAGRAGVAHGHGAAAVDHEAV